MPRVVYEDKPRASLWVKLMRPLMLVGCGAAFLLGIVSLVLGVWLGIILLVLAALFVPAFWLVGARRHEILDDGVRIVLGGPLSLHVPFYNIQAVEIHKGPFWRLAYAFDSPTGNRLKITRKKGCPILIEPSDCALFCQNLDEALGSWSKITSQR